jgi:AraC-like DNA-binding protein
MRVEVTIRREHKKTENRNRMSDKSSFAQSCSGRDRGSSPSAEQSSDRPSATDDTGAVIGTPEFSAAVLRLLSGRSGAGAVLPTGGFVAAVSLMLERPFAPHSVATLADAVGMSRSVFERQFAERFGIAPMAFLERERLRAAAHLLRTTNVSVAVIAKRVGFANRSDFSRAFADRYGLSPSALRERG